MKKLFSLLTILLFSASFIRAVAQAEDFAVAVAAGKANDEMTPLHQAAAAGHEDVAELLIANKADVNAKANDGSTPLHWAMNQGHADVAELLRQHGSHE